MRADYAILKYNKMLFINRFQAVKTSVNLQRTEIDELIDLFKRDVDKSFFSYSYFKLQSGRFCFVKAKSEEGNNADYFVECLIFDEIIFYPFQLIDAELKFSDFAEVQIKGPDITRVMEFAKNHSEIYGMISLLIKGKKVFISDEEVLNWLSVIYMAYPIRMAKNITFTTDEFLNIEFDIKFLNKNTPGFTMSFNSVFEFTKILEMGYLYNYNHILSFHAFLDDFGVEKIGEDIDKLYWVYKILDVELKDIDRQTFDEIADYAVSNLSDDRINEIFKKIEPNFELLITKLNINDLQIVVDLLKKIYLSNSFVINRCTEIMNVLFDDMILKTDEIQSVLDVYIKLSEEIKHHNLTLMRSQIKEERVKYIIAILNNNKLSKLAYYYSYIVLKSLIELDYTFSQSQKIENLNLLFEMIIDIIMLEFSYFKDILLMASKSIEFFVKILFMIADKIDSYEKELKLFEYLTEALDNCDEFNQYEIRKNIKKSNKRFLFEEYKIRLDRAEDKKTFFEEYLKNVFERFEDYYKEYFDKALKEYLLSLKDEEIFDESVKIIIKIINEKMILSDDAARILINCFEKGFDFKYKEEYKDIIKWIKLIKKIRRIETNNDIIALIDLALFLEENKYKKLFIDELLQTKGRASILGGYKYVNFISWTFPNIIRLIRDVEDHKKMVYFYNPEDDLNFYKFYIDNLFRLINEDMERGYNILLTFLVYFYFYVEPKYRLYGEETKTEEINKFLVERFKQNKNISIEKFNIDLVNEFDNNRLSVPIMWQQIYEGILKE
ncbi:hypothetical protein ABG79_01516 [Caloramator mitchellensis]|uniref:Uncharacterized protein n=1 Tax=Caloramator mitchellensis TaxID=908809 RepID=A0A0R3K0K0_CALMK|nr:hypothetical protein [Caloramator mitchellensis]KRQ86764.1 hypothetical protein ABG79_01516 [Caloramator mitchellensis]